MYRFSLPLAPLDGPRPVPLKIHGLTEKAGTFKIATLSANLLVVLHILLAERLFGLRGGRRGAVRRLSGGGGDLGRGVRRHRIMADDPRASEPATYGTTHRPRGKTTMDTHSAHGVADEGGTNSMNGANSGRRPAGSAAARRPALVLALLFGLLAAAVSPAAAAVRGEVPRTAAVHQVAAPHGTSAHAAQAPGALNAGARTAGAAPADASAVAAKAMGTEPVALAKDKSKKKKKGFFKKLGIFLIVLFVIFLLVIVLVIWLIIHFIRRAFRRRRD
ncbi:hypothetical protein ACIBK8_26065 [Streptomyces sp. NPDC050161]|uniref:hypothetical protein n=1 Tax=Streptomyces sp. NPDC050161 TaxID=3365604 RepID=UPI00378BBE5D